MIKNFFINFPRFSYLSPTIHKICIKALYKINKWSPYTGIAICGYGDKDFFPGCIVLNAYGVLNGHFLYVETMSSHVRDSDPGEPKATRIDESCWRKWSDSGTVV